MSKWLSEQLKTKWLFNIMIVMFFLFSVDAICTGIVSVMMDSEWSQLSTTQKLIRVCLIFKYWATSTIALLTTIAKKIEKDEPPIGDTTFLTKPTETKDKQT